MMISEIIFWSLFAIIGVTGIVVGIVFVVIQSNYELFDQISFREIEIKPGVVVPYVRIIMKFDRWRQLFEMNPSKFVFVKRKGEIMSPELMNYNVRYAHPCFQNESNEYILIDFRFREYIFYYFYKHKIYDRLSYDTEVAMTKEVAEDAQRKIQKILDESQKEIETALDAQKEIILRLHEEDPKR